MARILIDAFRTNAGAARRLTRLSDVRRRRAQESHAGAGIINIALD
jgi:hypothetical protein